MLALDLNRCSHDCKPSVPTRVVPVRESLAAPPVHFFRLPLVSTHNSPVAKGESVLGKSAIVMWLYHYTTVTYINAHCIMLRVTQRVSPKVTKGAFSLMCHSCAIIACLLEVGPTPV